MPGGYASIVDETPAEPAPFALDVIRPWPPKARAAAYEVLRVHGTPDHLEERALRWDELGPWKRVVVCADDGDQDVDDVVESVIDGEVPADRRADVEAVVAEFRITIEDDGEIAIVGPDLHCNAITLNVLHALLTRGLRPDEARAQRSADLAALRAGNPPPDAHELHLADDAPHGEPRSFGVDGSSSSSPGSDQS